MLDYSGWVKLVWYGWTLCTSTFI